MTETSRLSLIALASSCLVLAGCNDESFDVSKQYGPDPVLPAPSSDLLPALKVAEVVGWRDGQAPRVPEGLVVTPFAKGLANPRTVHTLPNGDVLVVQSKAPPGKPINRPKDIIRNFIMSIASGSRKGSRRRTGSRFCAIRIAMARSTSASSCSRGSIRPSASPGTRTRSMSPRPMRS